MTTVVDVLLNVLIHVLFDMGFKLQALQLTQLLHRNYVIQAAQHSLSLISLAMLN